MYKKLLAGLCIILCGTMSIAAEQEKTFKGFQNIEQFMQFKAINPLQAIADNDGVEFSKFWPEEYFYHDGISSYIYFAKNDTNSTDIIAFNYYPNNNECFTVDNPTFCIPEIKPNLTKYIYNKKFIVHHTPDFINSPDNNEIIEVLLKNGKYLDINPIKTLDPQSEEVTPLKICKHDKNYFLKSCKTYDNTTGELLFKEELIRKNKKINLDNDMADNFFEYIKYDSEGNKIEEYFYSSGKHILYNAKGEIIELCQWSPDRFRYYNVKKPDLYIDTSIIKDENDRIIKEINYDRNHKVMRKYTAEYKNDRILKIHVEDFPNAKIWEILPIPASINEKTPAL